MTTAVEVRKDPKPTVVIFRECLDDEVYGILERGPWHICTVKDYYGNPIPPRLALTSIWFITTIGM
jgi:hypothetical protein